MTVRAWGGCSASSVLQCLVSSASRSSRRSPQRGQWHPPSTHTASFPSDGGEDVSPTSCCHTHRQEISNLLRCAWHFKVTRCRRVWERPPPPPSSPPRADSGLLSSQKQQTCFILVLFCRTCRRHERTLLGYLLYSMLCCSSTKYDVNSIIYWLKAFPLLFWSTCLMLWANDDFLFL